MTRVGCIHVGREMGQVGVAFLRGSLPSGNFLVFLPSFDFPSARSSGSPKMHQEGHLLCATSIPSPAMALLLLLGPLLCNMTWLPQPQLTLPSLMAL